MLGLFVLRRTRQGTSYSLTLRLLQISLWNASIGRDLEYRPSYIILRWLGIPRRRNIGSGGTGMLSYLLARVLLVLVWIIPMSAESGIEGSQCPTLTSFKRWDELAGII